MCTVPAREAINPLCPKFFSYGGTKWIPPEMLLCQDSKSKRISSNGLVLTVCVDCSVVTGTWGCLPLELEVVFQAEPCSGLAISQVILAPPSSVKMFIKLASYKFIAAALVKFSSKFCLSVLLPPIGILIGATLLLYQPKKKGGVETNFKRIS